MEGGPSCYLVDAMKDRPRRSGSPLILCLLAGGGLASCEEPPAWLDEWSGEEPDAGPAERAPVFYSYVNERGRTVYVSHEEMIPGDHRDNAAPVDLSHVSTNPELGREWDETVEREHERLAATDYCVEVREEAEDGPVRRAFADYGHLIGIGGVMLLLIVTAPWMFRRVGVPRWTRTLAFILPVLAFLGLLTHIVVSTARAMERIQATADLCTPEAIDDDGSEARAQRLDVVSRLADDIRRAAEARQRAIDAQIEQETR